MAILTASDKGYAGQREDISGKVIKQIVESNGYEVVSYKILPDEQAIIAEYMRDICDNNDADLILTTGGTGFAKRDCTPEATLSIAQKHVPGIAEAIRAFSMQITKRAMLSRATSVIRGSTLIINLPGSPKAVKETLEYIIQELEHGILIMTGKDGECAR